MKHSFELKITLIYLLVGFLWILFSGEAVKVFTGGEGAAIIEIEKIKGWFFILVTGLLLFFLIKREVKVQVNLLNKLEQSQKELILHNERLTNYAFITSHKLRKPLANILGLVQIFNTEDPNDPQNKIVMENISYEAEEIDAALRTANSFVDGEFKG